jgi:hypothetical protein
VISVDDGFLHENVILPLVVSTSPYHRRGTCRQHLRVSHYGRSLDGHVE